jgi:hypothetical protein
MQSCTTLRTGLRNSSIGVPGRPGDDLVAVLDNRPHQFDILAVAAD